jgi:hypothetical protein
MVNAAKVASYRLHRTFSKHSCVCLLYYAHDAHCWSLTEFARVADCFVSFVLCVRILTYNNQADALEWLADQGFVCDEFTCQAAAARGELKILQWLHARGTPWIEQVSFPTVTLLVLVSVLDTVYANVSVQ